MQIKRHLLQKLREHLQQKEISVVIGPRQSGKTTLMKMLRDELKAAGKKTLFFNLDISSDAQYFSDEEKLLQKIRLEVGNQHAYIFIDEIQRKTNAGLFLKGLYDRELSYKWIVSGSGSLELKEKIAESLIGRKRLFELSTVNISEYLAYKTSYQYTENLKNWVLLETRQVELWLLEYLNFGGYPRVVTSIGTEEKNLILEEIFSSYMERDIRDLLNLDKSYQFSLMIRLLAARIGQITNYSSLSKETALSQPTLKKYLWFAEKTFIVQSISPFFRNPAKELVKAPEYYFYDLGLRNFSLNLAGQLDLFPRLGEVFENFIFNELRLRFQHLSTHLKYWRSKDQAEVDFIVEKGLAPLPVEVKCSHLQGPELSRSFRSFLEKYQPEEAWVVNLSFDAEIKVGSTSVRFLPWWEITL